MALRLDKEHYLRIFSLKGLLSLQLSLTRIIMSIGFKNVSVFDAWI